MIYILQKINNVFHPDRYQGWGKTSRYFEGWYFKLVNHDGSEALAIIPGIAIDEQGNKQAFIQVLMAKENLPATTNFHSKISMQKKMHFKFPLEKIISHQIP